MRAGPDRPSLLAPRDSVSGTFRPAGPPASPPVRVDAGGGCIVDLTQRYTMTGTLQGSLEVDYRIQVAGPCGAPPGTYDEDWIAHGTFAGRLAGTAVTAGLAFRAHVVAGGRVTGRITFDRGLRGDVQVVGRFSQGALRYAGEVSRPGGG